MSQPRSSTPGRPWLRRFIFLTAVIGMVSAAVFWYSLSADEPLISLPTFQATTVSAAGMTPGTPRPAATQAGALNTLTPIPTVSNTPPPNATLTPTPSPSLTPSSTPTSLPQPTVEIALFEPNFPTQVPAATPVERIEMPAGLTNILLIGTDAISRGDQDGTERTDSLILVSINRELGTASMLSIPRDLYAYIPGWQNSRINTAFARGNAVKYPGGGIQTLKDTILYNFGIPVHYYARIDFSGFEKIIDAVGGIEVINSCELEDWQLKEPGLDIEDEDNYIMYKLEPGVHEMDGFTALWYVRSRRTTSDFDRGRRQQQVLRALLNKGLDLNLLPQLPTLWEAFNDTIETDMDLGKILQLAAVAPAIRENGIQHLYLSQGEMEPYIDPETGAQVQIIHPEALRHTMNRLYDVPALNRSNKTPIYVEIINRTGNPDKALIAADNVRWFGFTPVITIENGAPSGRTSLEYHRSNLKGSYDWLVSWVFGLPAEAIELAPDQDAEFQYTAILGEDYKSCRNPLYAPRP